jgi:hypothetical protein
MSQRLARLFSPQALVGYMVPGARLVWAAIGAGSNAEFVKVHILSTGAWQFLATNSTVLSIVFGIAWLTAVVMKPEWFERKRRLGRGLETVSGRHFINETIHLDGHAYQGCVFTACHFIYHGFGLVSFDNKCIVKEKFFVISHDPAVDQYQSAERALGKMAEHPAIRLLGRRNMKTGEVRYEGVQPPTVPFPKKRKKKK